MHHRSAIAQTGDAVAVQQVGVYARHLWGAVGAQTERPARQLIDQLEGLKIECLASAREQGFKVLKQWRHDQLIAIAAGSVEQISAQLFDVPGLRGQDIGYLIRENPGRHECWCAVKNRILPGCDTPLTHTRGKWRGSKAFCCVVSSRKRAPPSPNTPNTIQKTGFARRSSPARTQTCGASRQVRQTGTGPQG